MTRMIAGAHGTHVPVRAAAAPVRLVRRAESAEPGQAAAAIYDEFGQRLHLLARTLTDDVDLAQILVIQAVVAHRHGPPRLRELAAGVYVAWIGWGNDTARSSVLPPPSGPGQEGLLGKVSHLPADQRAALGLCRFGNHTYRQAADLLKRTPDAVAHMLVDALRSLGPLPAA